MSSRIVILPYKISSLSAARLAAGLTTVLNSFVRRVKHDGRYRPKFRSLVVNYGSSILPHWLILPRERILNHPNNTAIASNKLTSFQAFQQHGVSILEWTTERNLAMDWMNSGDVVVCRTLLSSHSGRGIILASTSMIGMNVVPPAPLYVKYKKKRKEFRVHVFQNRVIDITEKRKIRLDDRPDCFNSYIRNHSNGWVFCRDQIVEPMDLRSVAMDACRAVGVDFGAVDIIWNERENKCYVLEVNTAPGLEGTTLINYVHAIINWQRNL